MKTVGVIGEGAWGTAVANLLASNGYHVKLWCHNPEVVKKIQENHINERYLPGIVLDEKIIPTTSLEEVICGIKWVFEAIPVQFLRTVLEQAKSCFIQEQVWVILSKGIEQNTLLLPSQIIDDVFHFTPHKAVVAGPSFAYDLARKQITAVSVAATDCQTGQELQTVLACSYFRPYLSLDLIGVQLGGALKNVITLGIGMLDGAGFTDNAKAFIFTRGLAEITQVVALLGGRPDTVYGLSGVGDLVLTSMGSLSKNLEVGKRLGRGENLETILQQTGFIPEGINTVKSLHQLVQQSSLKLPILDGIYQVIFGGKQLRVMLDEIMTRELESEC